MIDCNCIEEAVCEIVYGCGDSERWDDWIERQQITDRKRQCMECGEPIEQGEIVFYSRGWRWIRDEYGEYGYKDDDPQEDPESVCEDWTCLPCYRIRKDLYGDCMVYGQLRELIYECKGFDYVTGKERGNLGRD